MPATPPEQPPAARPSAVVRRAPSATKAKRAPRGPSPLKTSLTRREIVAAAVAEFLAVGIAKATMDRIAKRAGLAKGTLYLYFASKEAMLQGALQETVAASALASLDQPRLPGESVRRYIERLVLPTMANLHASGRMELARLMLGEARSFPALAQYYREHVFVPWHQHFNDLLQTAVDEGELRGITPASASLLLGAPMWLSIARDTVMGSAPRPGSSPVELMQAQIDAIFGVGR
jgi:TetR/AcrR family transcriptional regulator of autoinduction and epiphytic fitness